jgi:hypothetical protein
MNDEPLLKASTPTSNSGGGAAKKSLNYEILPNGVYKAVYNGGASSHYYVPMEAESDHQALDLMIPQHIKHQNHNFSEVAKNMQMKKAQRLKD